MFDEILGLPAHPLIIHAAVVLTPLAVLAAVVYAVLPRFRAQIAWAVVPLSVAAPVAVFAAKQSGEQFKERLFPGGRLPEGELGATITEHQGFATPLLLTSLGMAVTTLALVFGAERIGKVPAAVLSGVTVLLALAVGFYVLRAGHTGATAVWGG
ncbi:DUF2231 domain-containing protein [Streptosporangium soli]|nr:hypothetical protein [Streptosporangium sp. KLBMP 9127]